MAKKHKGLPKAPLTSLSKAQLLMELKAIDADANRSRRILVIETQLRTWIDSHVATLTLADAPLAKFNTSPFVLMIHCRRNNYSQIEQLEKDILPAKLFSSMETSAGRMVESIVLPAFGWEQVSSQMHSQDSVIDVRKVTAQKLFLATLKSGPRCLNDEMSKDIATDIFRNCPQWAKDADVKAVDFTFGALYGTQKQSNKKDWHILRNLSSIAQRTARCAVLTDCSDRWHMEYKHNGIRVRVTVRIGGDLWRFIGKGQNLSIDLCIALIRACVVPASSAPIRENYSIADLPSIVSMENVATGFNVRLLQRSQIPWLFFMMRHFSDTLSE